MANDFHFVKSALLSHLRCAKERAFEAEEIVENTGGPPYSGEVAANVSKAMDHLQHTKALLDDFIAGARGNQ